MKADTTLDVATFINARRIGPGQWTVIGLCAVVALMDGMDLQSIGLAAPAIGQELKIAPQSLGAIFSAALAGLALGAFVLGPTADRVGRKTVLIGATFLFGTFTVATAYATSFHVLLAFTAFWPGWVSAARCRASSASLRNMCRPGTGPRS